MDGDSCVIHFKLQSLGAYESFIERQLQQSKDYEPSFLFIKHAYPERPSPISSTELGFFGYGSWVLSSGREPHQRPRLIHAHFGTNAILALPAVFLHSLPLVVSFYGHDYSAFPGRFMGLGRSLLQPLFHTALKIIAMTDHMRSELLHLGCPEEKIVVHFPGIRSLDFHKEKAIGLSKLLMVSALRPKKNHVLVLRALKILRNRGLKLQLDIVGDGPLREGLQSQIKTLNLEDSVRLCGRYQSDSDLVQYFKQADLMLHPSTAGKFGDSEGLPSAILEALSVGLPTIVTGHAGLGDQINQGTAVVNERNPLSLARLLEELSTDLPRLQDLQNEALNFYSQNYLNKDFTAEREAIYDAAMEEYRIKNHGAEESEES